MEIGDGAGRDERRGKGRGEGVGKGGVRGHIGRDLGQGRRAAPVIMICPKKASSSF